MEWAVEAPPTAIGLLEAGLRQGTLWVATADGGVPVGFLLASEMDGALFINELAVAYDQQGRGLRHALIAAVVAHARDTGGAAVLLTTDFEIAWNRPLYEHLGFCVLDEQLLPPQLAARLRSEREWMPPSAKRCAMRLAVAR